jgi:sigma-B regulation protein RsbU (phosphoserine phosphatase)
MSTEDTINMGAVTARIRALAHNVQLSILIVDDDELERALIGDRLDARGFEVAHAADGREALAMLEKQSFPVLLIDWQMPVMDGIELTERLRARGMADTYIIMLTARDSNFDYERGYAAGVDDYLSKKVREAELLARIHAGFSTFALRCALKEARAALSAAAINKPGAT